MFSANTVKKIPKEFVGSVASLSIIGFLSPPFFWHDIVDNFWITFPSANFNGVGLESTYKISAHL